jgi:hypothetical protein
MAWSRARSAFANSMSGLASGKEGSPLLMTPPEESEMTEKQTCVPGCMRFDGGEKRHHPDCPFYAESLTKMNADRIAALEAENRQLLDRLDTIETMTATPDGLSPEQTVAVAQIAHGGVWNADDLQENDNG